MFEQLIEWKKRDLYKEHVGTEVQGHCGSLHTFSYVRDRLPKVKRCEDPAWLCVQRVWRVGWDVQRLWGWWYVGHSHHASLAPLVRVDSNGGVGGAMQLGRAARAVGFRVAKENEEMKRVMRIKCVWLSGGDSYGGAAGGEGICF